MISIENLVKRHGSREVLHGVSLEARPGRVTGFVGPNGAGKSSTLRCLLGLDRADGGTALIDGRPYRELRDPLRAVGAVLDGSGAHPSRTARGHLGWVASGAGISRRRVAEVLDVVGLSDAAGRRVRTFSLGMGQRLGLATALLGDPEVLVLDEPVNGLDPVGVVEVRRLLSELSRERGTTILVSSHNLPELYQTATDYLIVDRGRLCRALGHAELAERCSRRLTLRCSDAPGLVRALEEMGAGRLSVLEDGTVRLLDPPSDREALVRGLVARDLVPTTIAEEGQTLEEYFLSVIGSDPRSEKGAEDAPPSADGRRSDPRAEEETARSGTRTAITRSDPRAEEEPHAQSAAR